MMQPKLLEEVRRLFSLTFEAKVTPGFSPNMLKLNNLK